MKFNFKKAAALFLAALTLSGVSAGASTAFADGTDDSSSSGSTHTLNPPPRHAEQQNAHHQVPCDGN